MASRGRSDLPAIGFTSAVTTLTVAIIDQVWPFQPIKPLVVLFAGLLASIIWFEIMSRYQIWRLRQEKQGLVALLDEYRELDEAFEKGVGDRIRYLTAQDASKKRIAELEAELDQIRAQYTYLFSKLRKRIGNIIDQVPD